MTPTPEDPNYSTNDSIPEKGEGSDIERSGELTLRESPDYDENDYEDDETPKQKCLRPQQGRFVAYGLGLVSLVIMALVAYFIIQIFGTTVRKPDDIVVDDSAIISLEELSQHTAPDDCWLAIHDGVYDLTEYAAIHPGGNVYIHALCGENATNAFIEHHPRSFLDIYVASSLLGQLVVEEEKDVSTTEEQGEEAVETQPPASETVPSTPAAASPQDTLELCPVQFYTIEDVKVHDSTTSCWYILYGRVYDFTTFITMHPGGGFFVTTYCGTDATDVFDRQPLHDENMLLAGFSDRQIGRFSTVSGVQMIPCNA